MMGSQVPWDSRVAVSQPLQVCVLLHEVQHKIAAVTPGAGATLQQEGRFLGGVGDEAYGKETTNQLDSSNLWRTFFVGNARQAPPTARL